MGLTSNKRDFKTNLYTTWKSQIGVTESQRESIKDIETERYVQKSIKEIEIEGTVINRL